MRASDLIARYGRFGQRPLFYFASLMPESSRNSLSPRTHTGGVGSAPVCRSPRNTSFLHGSGQCSVPERSDGIFPAVAKVAADVVAGGGTTPPRRDNDSPSIFAHAHGDGRPAAMSFFAANPALRCPVAKPQDRGIRWHPRALAGAFFAYVKGGHRNQAMSRSIGRDAVGRPAFSFRFSQPSFKF